MQHLHVELLRRGGQAGQELRHHAGIPQGHQRERPAAGIERKRLLSFAVSVLQPFVQLIDRQAAVQVKIRFGRFQKGIGIEVFESAKHAVGREYHQPGMVHLHEHHHHIIRAAAHRCTLRAALVAVVERRLIAVMPVRDVQLGIGEALLDGMDHRFIGDRPQTVLKPRFVGDVRKRRLTHHQREDILRFAFAAVIAVERIDIAEIAGGAAHQLEPVGLRLGQGFLVRQHNALFKFLQLDLCD